MSNAKSTRISGTNEWSVASVNCVNGCEHNCRYCYARYNACERYHRIKLEDWPEMKVRTHDVKKRCPKVDGTVMFPTTHDITPSVLFACSCVLEKLVMAGNDVLIVSKPHLDCIEHLCKYLRRWQDQILFRFSIGAMDDSLLAYWEPGAPLFEERLASLRYAHKQGYQTSVSCEPLLDSPNVGELVDTLLPYVSDTIWIGKMNGIRSRVVVGTSRSAIAAIENGQTDEAIRDVYNALSHQPKVRWKESYKSVLGLELAQEAGLDV